MTAFRHARLTFEQLPDVRVFCNVTLHICFRFRLKMAAGGVPELGGYEYEFVGEIPDDWDCLVCQLPLKDPIQIEKCGHRLCEICVGTILRYRIGRVLYLPFPLPFPNHFLAL